MQHGIDCHVRHRETTSSLMLGWMREWSLSMEAMHGQPVPPTFCGAMGNELQHGKQELACMAWWQHRFTHTRADSLLLGWIGAGARCTCASGEHEQCVAETRASLTLARAPHCERGGSETQERG
jgi:hypothetical protein